MSSVAKWIGVVVFLFALPLFSQDLDHKTVRFCGDGAEWPPYMYYERDSFGEPTGTITGASLEALRKIFEGAGYPLEYDLIPWKRCMSAVQFFHQDKTYEAFSDGSSNPEREENFFRTDPFYALTFLAYYSKKKFPNGLDVSQPEKVNAYNLCGTQGYNFQPFYDAGIKKEIDVSARDSLTNLKKLMMDRCDLFLTQLEVIQGGAIIGQYKIPDELQSIEIPGVKRQPFYFWVAKKSPRAQQLVDDINTQMRKLKKSNEWEKIYQKYLPQGSGLKP